MAISGVGQSYYQNNVATTKSTKSVNSTGETGNTKELSEAEEMAIFKKEFYAEIDKIPRNRTTYVRWRQQWKCFDSNGVSGWNQCICL